MLGQASPRASLLPVSQYEYSLNPAIRPVKTPLKPLNFPHSWEGSSYREVSPALLCNMHHQEMLRT